MKSTPSSGSRFSTAIALSWSRGGPQIPSPVTRMAPKPRRVTSRSPPILNVPDAVAVVVMATTYPSRRDLLDGDGLREVARLVDVQPAGARDRVGDHLQRDDREDRLEHPVGPGHPDDLLGVLADVHVALGG